jgi:hypothetical protein
VGNLEQLARLLLGVSPSDLFGFPLILPMHTTLGGKCAVAVWVVSGFLVDSGRPLCVAVVEPLALEVLRRRSCL